MGIPNTKLKFRSASNLIVMKFFGIQLRYFNIHLQVLCAYPPRTEIYEQNNSTTKLYITRYF